MGNIDSSNNISRPRDGSNMGVRDALPFASSMRTKTEIFNTIEGQIQDAREQGNMIPDATMNQLVLNISGRETTPEELLKATETTQKLIASASLLSENAQKELVDTPSKIVNHRNASTDVQEKGKALYQDLAAQLPTVTSGEVQKELLQAIDNADTSEKRHSWHVALFESIDQNADQGIDNINAAAQRPLIRLIGDTAQNLPAVSANEQASFQQSAMHMLQRAQFPYKFDADAFREALVALSAVPENVRTAEYSKFLKDEENKELSTQAAE
ncbi:MAG: hypothetical protein K2L24_03555 [Opitutales bacterium]|nr:hypothetical protein [Opitutales bacterium]